GGAPGGGTILQHATRTQYAGAGTGRMQSLCGPADPRRAGGPRRLLTRREPLRCGIVPYARDPMRGRARRRRKWSRRRKATTITTEMTRATPSQALTLFTLPTNAAALLLAMNPAPPRTRDQRTHPARSTQANRQKGSPRIPQNSIDTTRVP